MSKIKDVLRDLAPALALNALHDPRLQVRQEQTSTGLTVIRLAATRAPEPGEIARLGRVPDDVHPKR